MIYQRQDSLHAQMVDIQKKAVEMGCYDGADWITRNYFSSYEKHLRGQFSDGENKCCAPKGI